MRFRPAEPGHAGTVIGVGIALIVIGIIFLFVLPWVGVPIGIVGLALLVIWLAGFGRAALRGETPAKRRSEQDV